VVKNKVSKGDWKSKEGGRENLKDKEINFQRRRWPPRVQGGVEKKSDLNQQYKERT